MTVRRPTELLVASAREIITVLFITRRRRTHQSQTWIPTHLPLTTEKVQMTPSLKTIVSREETTRALTMSTTYLEFVQFRKSESEIAKETSKP